MGEYISSNAMGRMADVEAMLATMVVECDQEGREQQGQQEEGSPGLPREQEGQDRVLRRALVARAHLREAHEELPLPLRVRVSPCKDPRGHWPRRVVCMHRPVKK